MKVERVYTRNIVGIPRSGTIEEAAESMRRFHVGTLVVTEKTDAGEEIVGIVTDRDLVVHALAEGLNAHKVCVDKVMIPVVASVAESADLLDALERMRAAGVRRLLVTKDGAGSAGILSLDDVLDGLVAELATVVALLKTELRHEARDLDGRAAA